eukprot:GGOE01004445.1.p3 GENE.GGOE01004445.1~~GGOE01004445.1.p3  ORF type:complete len:110 (-),score=8.91 GGOE01004445.1:577-906(-)
MMGSGCSIPEEQSTTNCAEEKVRHHSVPFLCLGGPEQAPIASLGPIGGGSDARRCQPNFNFHWFLPLSQQCQNGSGPKLAQIATVLAQDFQIGHMFANLAQKLPPRLAK